MHTIILSSAVVLAVMISLMSVSRVDSACLATGAGNTATLTATGTVQTGQKQAAANRPYGAANDPCTWTLTPQNKEILVRFTQGNLREVGTTVALANFKGGAAGTITGVVADPGTSLVDLSFVASSTGATTIAFTSAAATLATRREVKFQYFLGCGESITLPATAVNAATALTFVHPKKGDNSGLLDSNCVVTIKTTAPQYASITRTPTYGYAGNQACAAAQFGMTLTGVKSESGTKLCKAANMASTTRFTSGTAGQDVVITFNSGTVATNVNTAKIAIVSSNHCIEKNTLSASNTVQSVAMSTAATITPAAVATCEYEIVSDKLAVVNMQAFNGGTSATALRFGGFGNAAALTAVATSTQTASTLFAYPNVLSTIRYTYAVGTAVATPMKFSLIKLCDQTIALPAAGITFASPKALNAAGAFVNDLKAVATCKVTFTSANGFSSTITNAVFPTQTTCTANYFRYTLQGKTAEAQICDAATLSTAKTLTTGSSLTFAFAASTATRFNVKISPTTTTTTKSVNAMQFNLAALLISLAAVLTLKF